MKKLSIFLGVSALLLLISGCGISTTSSLTPIEVSKDGEPAKTAMTNSIESQENLFAKYSGATIKTSLGNIKVKFYSESPITVNNFMNLAQANVYDGTKFHRIIADFMIQGGDPLSKDDTKPYLWGTGGPDYRFNDEFNAHKLVRGSLAMANAGANTNGSQFFIVTADSTPWLDGKHTNFGYVTDGMDIVEKAEKAEVDDNDRPVAPIIVKSIELTK